MTTSTDIINYILEAERVTLAALQIKFPMEPYLFDAILSEVHASRKITVSGTTYKKRVKKIAPPLWIDTVTDYPEVTPDTTGDPFTMDETAMWQPKDKPRYNRAYGYYPRRKNTKRDL